MCGSKSARAALTTTETSKHDEAAASRSRPPAPAALAPGAGAGIDGGHPPAGIRWASPLLPRDRHGGSWSWQVRGRGGGHRGGALLLLRGVGAEPRRGPGAPVAHRRPSLLRLQRPRLRSRPREVRAGAVRWRFAAAGIQPLVMDQVVHGSPAVPFQPFLHRRRFIRRKGGSTHRAIHFRSFIMKQYGMFFQAVFQKQIYFPFFFLSHQGYLVGNPITDPKFDENFQVPAAHGFGIISDQIYEAAMQHCKGDYVNPVNQMCAEVLQTVNSTYGYYLSYFWMNNKMTRDALGIKQVIFFETL
ncbi:unnamed protein product [Triticum turgidum subsp. durum]|uniref:Uncharacterized protein n=1 Tax=Triticum turgidum subsp. durum TaxID=4567 RepID=A0A9R0ZUP1_TRITD|nr:unnamed protein product [Triticum turgidum subsp. durum]